jgi:hypothetical protein
MVYALKVENLNKLPVPQFLLVGLNRFRQAEHTAKFEPAKIELNPKDIEKLPSRLMVKDIPVVPNEELEPGFLRVVTEDIPEVEE